MWFICTKPAHLRPHWCPCPAVPLTGFVSVNELLAIRDLFGNVQAEATTNAGPCWPPFLWSKLICWKRVCYWKIEKRSPGPKKENFSKLLFPADVEFHQVLWVLCPAGSLRSGRKLQLRKAAVGPHGLDDVDRGFAMDFCLDFKGNFELNTEISSLFNGFAMKLYTFPCCRQGLGYSCISLVSCWMLGFPNLGELCFSGTDTSKIILILALKWCFKSWWGFSC